MWDCLDEWNTTLPEGLPTRIMKKFQETRWCAVMVRKNFLDLRNNFRRNVDPAITTNLKDIRNKCLGWPTSCGKNIALAMLFHWARTEGWLVLYVPQGKDWTHGGFFYRNTYSVFLIHQYKLPRSCRIF